MTDEAAILAREAADLRVGLETLFSGRRTAATLWAMASVIAEIAIDLDDPDVEKVLAIIGQGARDEFVRKLKERQH